MSRLNARLCRRLYLPITLLLSALWSATSARLLAELWPYRLIALASPVALIIFGAIGVIFGYIVFRSVRYAPGLVWPLGLSALYLLQSTVAPTWGIAALLAGLVGVIELSGRWPTGKGEWLLDVLAFVAPLALFVATCAPSVLPGDSAEFQFVVPTLGIPHPTGYPLYLLLGRLFILLPLGSVAYRLNLFSAVAAAAAVWALYRATRALDLSRAAALIGAALLAVSETFWSQATIAEKYALNAFFVALTLWLGLEWRRRQTNGWLGIWAFCYGLSLTHHRTMLMLAPAFLLLIWLTDHTALRPRSLLRTLILFFIPLSLYLLLPLFSSFNPPYAYVRIDSPRAFFDLVLARTYQSGLFRSGLAALPGRMVELGTLLWRQFGPPGLLIALGGWLCLLFRQRTAAWTLLAGIVGEMIFALNYYVPNTAVYYLPAYVWLALCAAVAVETVAERLTKGATASSSPTEQITIRSQVADANHHPGYVGKLRRACRTVFRQTQGEQLLLRMLSRWKNLFIVAAPAAYSDDKSPPTNHNFHLPMLWIMSVATLPLWLGISRFAGHDQRRAYAGLSFDYTYGQMALRAVEDNALIIGDWLPATVLWYSQLVEGLAPTAHIIAVDSLEWQWQGYVEQGLREGRPVYLARPLMVAGERYALKSAGPLVQVSALPTPPDDNCLAPSESKTGIRLCGFDLWATPSGVEGQVEPVRKSQAVKGGSTLHLTLYWKPQTMPAGDYAVTVRLIDPAGQARLEKQNRHPVGGSYPTSRWQASETVPDYYRLPLPAALPSGRYSLQAELGPPFQAGDRFQVAWVEVNKPPRPTDFVPATPLRRSMDGLVLLGHDAPRRATLGETVTLSVLWLVQHTPEELPILVLQDGTERILSPTYDNRSDWQPGAQIVQQYRFAVTDTSTCEVRVGTRSLRLPLRPVEAPPPLANFGNLIRLRSYRYEQRTLSAGETVRLTLNWEAIGAINEPYKVFVHVLGHSGLPVAQQDNEPLNGTYPTTRWTRGERIADPYAFSLPADLPPGEYQVEVGLYRLSDLGRLPVLDAGQKVVDDKVFLQPIQVIGP